VAARLTRHAGMVRLEYMRRRINLNQRQKEILVQRLGELGNIAIGSLVFGFVLRSEAFNILSLMLGLVIAAATYVFAVILEK
jgi:hypothetical protein